METTLEKKLGNFISSIKKSIEEENWYSALAVSLMLPDICGNLEWPNKKSTSRYIKWFKENLQEQTYTSYIGADRKKHVFLTGDDCYGLRCSYLHAGQDNINAQSVQKALNEFVFVAPEPNTYLHRNYKVDSDGQKLQLQIDKFCLEICEGVENWIDRVKNNTDIQERARNMMEIQSIYSLRF